MVHILDVCAGALEDEASRLRLEQAPHGIDSLDELALHPVVADGLRAQGWGVHAEQRYPGDAAYPRRSEGLRCDLVLTRDPDSHLADPLLAGTLFEGAGVDPREALWLEIKVVGQFALCDGAARANPAYASQLLQLVSADVRKLGRDPLIAQGAVLLILFTADCETARHDLGVWTGRARDAGLAIAPPLDRSFLIPDHIGNATCMLVLIEGLGP